MKDKIIFFLPYRLGSENFFHTNIRSFSSFAEGLIEIKLLQLLVTKKICLYGKLVGNERESLCAV